MFGLNKQVSDVEPRALAGATTTTRRDTLAGASTVHGAEVASKRELKAWCEKVSKEALDEMGVVDRHRHEQLESQLAACQLQLPEQAKLLEMLARSHLGEVAALGDNGVATIVAAMEEMEAQARVAEDVAENMFSYAMRVVPAREVEPRSRLVALCFLLLCLSWQLVFAFGFLDASMLLYLSLIHI